MSKYGIKETLEVLGTGKALAKAYAEAKADGVINVKDAPKAKQVVVAAQAAYDDIHLVPLELADLNPFAPGGKIDEENVKQLQQLALEAVQTVLALKGAILMPVTAKG